MLPSSFAELLNTFAKHQSIAYVILGTLLVIIGLHYARKNNHIHEGEPPLLPGALPIFGHALAFLRNGNKVYEAARDWSQNSHPVSLSIAGRRVYVVLNPKDISAAWRAKTLCFDSICRWAVQKILGMSEDGSEKMTTDPDGHGDMFTTRHDYWRDAMAPGPALDSLTMNYLRFLEVDFANLERSLRNAPDQEEIVSLHFWCRDRMGIAATNAFIGPRLLANEPKMLEYLTVLRKSTFKLALGLPKWIAKDAYEAREKLIRGFMKWGVDEEGMLSHFRKRSKMFIARGMNLRDVAVVNYGLWMASQVNANPTMFWLLYGILLHPKERAIIEKEIAPAFSPSSSNPNVETISNINVLVRNAPLLNAMLWEAMRYAGSVLSTREVTEDTIINGWKFVKGSTMTIPHRMNHQDPKTYGGRIDEFVPDRFLNDFTQMDSSNNQAAGDTSIKSMRPFGGGVTHCPGRHFAVNEITTFIATVLRRFDIQLVEGQTEAKPLTSYLAAGTYPPDRDVSVRIRLRR